MGKVRRALKARKTERNKQSADTNEDQGIDAITERRRMLGSLVDMRVKFVITITTFRVCASSRKTRIEK